MKTDICDINDLVKFSILCGIALVVIFGGISTDGQDVVNNSMQNLQQAELLQRSKKILSSLCSNKVAKWVINKAWAFHRCPPSKDKYRGSQKNPVPNSNNASEEKNASHPSNNMQNQTSARIVNFNLEGLNSTDIFNSTSAAKVTVYSYNNFEGAFETFEIPRECFTLPDYWQLRISSINTNNHCVHVCKYKNCGGRCIRVAPGTPGHNRLRKINFDKRITSIRKCI